MVNTEHVLEQMRAANPAPSLEQLAADDLHLVRDIVARVRLALPTPVEEQPQMRPDRLGRRWRMHPVLVTGLASILVLATLGGALLLVRGSDGEPATGGFTCPSGSTPDQPGPVDQPRPPQGDFGYTTFDPGSGRVLMITDDKGFWTFDVCTNTWAKAPPAPGDIGWVSDFVYDVDSARAITFGFRHSFGFDEGLGVVAYVWAYEPDGQTWTAKRTLVVRSAGPDTPHVLKAAYDPATGLVVVHEQAMAVMWTYDVDTDTWAEIDRADWPWPEALTYDPFLTYDASVDRLVVYHSGDSTWEFDIRAGRWERHLSETLELAHQGFGWAPTGEEFVYDEANEVSVFFDGSGVWTYDASEHRWSEVEIHTMRLYADDARRGGSAVPPMTYDPVNERIVMISGDNYPWPGVIAHDVATGEWTTLLEPTH